MNIERGVPQAVESEQAVLGALLMSPESIDRVDWLPEAAFFRGAHRAIYRVVRSLAESGKAIDPVLVAERLDSSGELEDAGGRSYLAALAVEGASPATLVRHAEVVKERFIRRQILAYSNEIGDRAHDTSEDAAKLAEEAEDRFLSVLAADRAGQLQPFRMAVAEAVDWLDAPEQGLSSGYPNIDRVWGGMRPGDLIVIAGRPSMGKSALAFNIAEHVAHETPVLAFSLEMTSRALAARSVRYHRALTSQSEAVRYLMDLKLWIDETPGIGAGYVRARAKRLKRSHGLGLIVVDYLQLMTGQGENRTQEVASISRGLKAIAKEYQVPVIAVSQLSRGVENRPDRRPVISDLRESGQVEQDADVISFVYREEYYVPDTPLAGIAEVLTRKHREGATGTSYLRFESQYARFKNMEGPLPTAPEPERRPRRYTAGKRTGDVVDFKKTSGGDAS